MSVEVTILFEDNAEADEFLKRFGDRQRYLRASIIGEKADNEGVGVAVETPSYHDLYITTEKINRRSISDLGYGLEVSCNRVGAWCLWDFNRRGPGPIIPGERNPLLIAGEFEGRGKGLRLDVGGHVIVDSLTPRKEEE